MVLKFSPLAIYIFSFLLPNSLVIKLSFVTIIAAMEFWFTKNILGRKLVGLRWYRLIENGQESIEYDGKDEAERPKGCDQKFFWGLLGICFAAWGVLLFLNLLSITNLMIILIPFTLQGVNLFNFYKCSNQAKAYTNKLIKENQ